jgi:membrane protease YdiL (CAAX protease family)
MVSPKELSRHPGLVRFAPFLVVVLLTACQGKLGAGSAYWLYFVKTLIGLGLVLALRPVIAEMRWAFSWEAVATGILVFAVWVGINGPWSEQSSLWVKLGLVKASTMTVPSWNPEVFYGRGSVLAWFFIAVRILGSALVIPPIEEIFYRSFLYRYLAKHEFLSVPLNRFVPLPFLATVAIFGFAHNEWLAGLFCGAAYQWLVIRKGRLGDAMTAHAITNFLLGVWVVWRGDWHFW